MHGHLAPRAVIGCARELSLSSRTQLVVPSFENFPAGPGSGNEAIEPNLSMAGDYLRGLGPGLGPTEFLAPRGLAVDSHGDLYVGEVSWTNWPGTFRDKPRPDNLRSLHKFRKVV